MTMEDGVKQIHRVASLTHHHLRANIACGLYYFMASAILDQTGTLTNRLSSGMQEGISFYHKDANTQKELMHYERLFSINRFYHVKEQDIRSSGYVVDSLEAAIWCLIHTDSFEQCIIKTVNLGDDTDTVTAIAGGLAGLYYGYESIPKDWLSHIKRREWIEELCEGMSPDKRPF